MLREVLYAYKIWKDLLITRRPVNLPQSTDGRKGKLEGELRNLVQWAFEMTSFNGSIILPRKLKMGQPSEQKITAAQI
jgi:hypothetical protein